MSIGYASVNSITMDISGEVSSKEQTGVYITDVEYSSDVNADKNESNIINAYQTVLNSNIVLSSDDKDSSITYKVEVYNSSDYTYYFNESSFLYGDTTYNNLNIVFELSDISHGDLINSGEYKTFYITFKYKDDVLDSNSLTSYINFEFKIKTYLVAEYEYTNDSYETFVVPITGTYKIELWGAQGGAYSSDYPGGAGGYTSGEILLEKDNELYIYLGEKPSDYNGGYNGGGYGTHDFENGGLTRSFAGGGGATDVRLVSGNWNSFDSLKSRIMVAGAGSGGYYWAKANSSDKADWSLVGQAAGGLTGYYNTSVIDTCVSTGGSQTSGGVCDTYSSTFGGFGYGGTGLGSSNKAGAASGGGSGYYGGAGRYDLPSSSSVGGAGSSFISGHDGCDAISENSTSSNIIHTGQSIHYSGYKFSNTIMIDGLGYKWTNEKGNSVVGVPTYDGKSTMTGNTSQGHAKITFLEEKE